MTGPQTDSAGDELCLRSHLSDIAQVPAWIEDLASRHAIPENVEYAINLCLEEAVSNIIRHGYGTGKTDGSVTLRFMAPKPDSFVFVVEDQAQPFNPLDVPAPDPQGKMGVGGHGIHFIRQFADGIEYERTPGGNRLRMRFSRADPAF